MIKDRVIELINGRVEEMADWVVNPVGNTLIIPIVLEDASFDIGITLTVKDVQNANGATEVSG